MPEVRSITIIFFTLWMIQCLAGRMWAEMGPVGADAQDLDDFGLVSDF